ncbi:MAG: YsnF/AvaK domain-containing protein [Ktedonobacterales bacterium]
MLDNTYSQDNTMGQQFGAGTPVYDVNGTKVGTVSEQGVQGDNLVLQKGLFFPHDYFVPLRAITHADADGLYLSVTKDDVTNQTFDNVAPAGNVGGASAYSDRATSYQAPDVISEGSASDAGYIGEGADSDIGSHDTPVREGDVRVPVREEELNVGKQQAEMGRAHIHKDVVEEQQTVNVPTTYEELHVERVPVRGGASDVGPDAFTDRDIDIPLRGEEVVATKEARVAEEVRLRKQHVTENQRVGDTVRKERVRIEGSGVDQAPGDVPLDSDTTAYSQDTGDTQQRGGI